jgi:predicted metal-dependent phosphoesterase TrpH
VIDLHTHSTASDGTLSPSELVSQAAMAGVKILALTDHDCVAGIAEAHRAAKQNDIRLIPGIELSVMWSGRALHLVGLNIDVNNQPLGDVLQEVLDFRVWRAEEIARKLEAHGVENALDGVRTKAKTDLIGRAHFARYLVDQGFAKDFRQVFKRFLVKGKPGYVGGEWMPLATGIELIHQAGGVAVLAHPARYNLSRTKLRGLFKELKALGANGIEVVSGCHSKEENQTMAQHALDFGLPASQGSDYHGPDKPWVQLGRLPPMYYRCTPIWEAGLDITS